MKSTENQQGFAGVEAFLILIVLAIVGFTGWFVYHSKQATDSTLNATGKSTLAVPKKSAAQTKPNATPSETTKYLVIQDFGVKLPLPAGLEDAYYLIIPTHDASYQTYGLSTLSLTKLDPSCGADHTSPVALSRQTAAVHDANATQDNPLNNPVYTTKIGNYYYQLIHAQAACSSSDATNQIQLKDAALFKTAFDGIQAIN